VQPTGSWARSGPSRSGQDSLPRPADAPETRPRRRAGDPRSAERPAARMHPALADRRVVSRQPPVEAAPSRGLWPMPARFAAEEERGGGAQGRNLPPDGCTLVPPAGGPEGSSGRATPLGHDVAPLSRPSNARAGRTPVRDRERAPSRPSPVPFVADDCDLATTAHPTRPTGPRHQAAPDRPCPAWESTLVGRGRALGRTALGPSATEVAT